MKEDRNQVLKMLFLCSVLYVFIYPHSSKAKGPCHFVHICMVSHFSHVRLFATPWTVAHQAPLSIEFSRQEYWSGCQALLQGIFLTQGSNGVSYAPALTGGVFTTEPPGKPSVTLISCQRG